MQSWVWYLYWFFSCENQLSKLPLATDFKIVCEDVTVRQHLTATFCNIVVILWKRFYFLWKFPIFSKYMKCSSRFKSFVPFTVCNFNSHGKQSGTVVLGVSVDYGMSCFSVRERLANGSERIKWTLRFIIEMKWAILHREMFVLT